MVGFCQHCGKELEGDEPYCPECGMPTGTVPVRAYPAAKKNNSTAIAIIVIAVIAALCIAGIALLPSLVDVNTDKYRVTVTVDGFNVDVADITQYTDIASNCEIVLSLRYDCGSDTLSEQIVLDRHYNLNNDYKSLTDVKSSVKIAGDPKDLKITAFLLITGPEWNSGSEKFYDYIDIYSVDKSKITSGSSLYYGETGIVFSMDDLDKDGKFTMSGDSDPKGTVDVTVTAVKN
ncbi:MAG: zinc ribbon domain-containing protein [Candidatus Methanomethylophilaceae archaeon]|nr:zinc ribbon domain-containing protein [Candidatus Methanomethylophilaceae archaeon]